MTALHTPTPAIDLLIDAVGLQHLERVFDVGKSRRLIFPYCQDVVGLLSDDLLRDGLLAADGIDSHHRCTQFQGCQQLWNRRNLVGLGISLALR
ncbi:MAG: hypothetical protein ABSD67_25800 [Terracidiphilus sp.]